MFRTAHRIFAWLLIAVPLVCSNCTAPRSTSQNPPTTQVVTNVTRLPTTSVPRVTSTATSVQVQATPTETSTPIPSKEKPAQREPTATVPPVSLFYNLPPATLTLSTGLYASPNRGEHIVPTEIPAGQTVYVMGKNRTGSHLRVVWGTGVGWVPVSFTDYNGRRDLLAPLPIFSREPPGCAVPITTQFALNSNWASDRRQAIAVVVDLFRSRYGDFPTSYLSLTVNNIEIKSTKRQITERGQFSLKDIVFTLPGYVEPGDTIGYRLDTTSDEPLSFMATIFSVPDGCQWDTK